MKIFSKLIFTLVIMVSGLAQAQGTPLVSTSDNFINFGYVPQWTDLYRIITIKSNIDEPLVIGRINTYCNCIEVTMEKTEIPPHDSIQIKLALNTNKLVGNLLKVTHIYDDNDVRLAKITVMASIYKNNEAFETINVEPPIVNFSQFGEDFNGEDKLDFAINNVSDETVPLELMRGDSKYFDLDFPVFVKPKSHAKGTIRLTDLGKTSEFAESFTFNYINSKSETKIFSVPIKRKVFEKKGN